MATRGLTRFPGERTAAWRASASRPAPRAGAGRLLASAASSRGRFAAANLSNSPAGGGAGGRLPATQSPRSSVLGSRRNAGNPPAGEPENLRRVGGQRLRLRFVDVEHRDELGDGQNVVDLRRKVEEL